MFRSEVCDNVCSMCRPPHSVVASCRRGLVAVPSNPRRCRVFLVILYRKRLSGRNNGRTKSIFHPGAYSRGTQPPLLYCSVKFLCFMRFSNHYSWHSGASSREGNRVLAMCSILMSGLFDVVLRSSSSHHVPRPRTPRAPMP